MFEIKEKPKMVERALLVGAYTRDEERAEADSLLEELAELVRFLAGPESSYCNGDVFAASGGFV